MILAFTDGGWEDYQHWVNRDRQFLKRVNQVIDATLRDPYEGIGKPKQLSGNLSPAWSRRITQEHRLVYRVVDDRYLIVMQARGHYQGHSERVFYVEVAGMPTLTVDSTVTP